MKNMQYWPRWKKFSVIGGFVFLVITWFAGFIHTGFKSWSPITIIKNIFSDGYPIGEAALIVFALALGFGYRMLVNSKNGVATDELGRRFLRRTQKQSYGDAHFETPEEYESVAVVQKVEDACGTILGSPTQVPCGQVLNTRMDNKRSNLNIMVCGSTGSGKSSTFTIPYVFQSVKRRESMIINDPDGGLYRDIAGYLKDQGYVVKRLDLAHPSKSDGWDCLKSVAGANMQNNADLFSYVAVSNFPTAPTGIYFDGPQSLLTACILRVMAGPDYTPERKNIKSVYELLQHPGGFDHIQAIFEASVNEFREQSKIWMPAYYAFVQSSANLRGNLVTNLATGLSLLQQESYQELLSIDDIDLELPAKRPCAYFCVFPAHNNRNQFLISLFFSMLFIRLYDVAECNPNGRCKVPVNFVLDEFATIGKIPDFDNKMATVRKAGIQCVLIFQNLSQLQKNYDKTWKTLMDSCSTFLAIGTNDPDTATLLQKRIGETTIEVETEKRNAIDSPFAKHDTSAGGGRRSLIDYSELFRMHQDRSVIIIQGHNPILMWKYLYTNHPEAKKLREILISDIPDISDKEGRERRRQEDEDLLNAWLAKHPEEDINRDYRGRCEPMKQTTATDKIKLALAEIIKKVLGIKTVQSKGQATVAEPIHTVDNAQEEEIIEVESVEEESLLMPVEPVVDEGTGEVLYLPPMEDGSPETGSDSQTVPIHGADDPLPDSEDNAEGEEPLVSAPVDDDMGAWDDDAGSFDVGTPDTMDDPLPFDQPPEEKKEPTSEKPAQPDPEPKVKQPVEKEQPKQPQKPKEPRGMTMYPKYVAKEPKVQQTQPPTIPPMPKPIFKESAAMKQRPPITRLEDLSKKLPDVPTPHKEPPPKKPKPMP